MGLINISSNNSVWRGLDYCNEKKVINYTQISDTEFEGIVSGTNNNEYDVFMDTSHPRSSKCNCPHAKDKRIICKHIMALYFTVFPNEIDNFLKEVEDAEKEYEEYEKELQKKLVKYVHTLSKSELQQTVLDLLSDAPEWMYDRFIRNKVGY